jgi:Na+/H+ antiporter NhaD/arsenite permease-like protein
MKIVQFIRGNIVLAIAILAAAVTTCFVPPDKQWLSYFDWKTLTCLFCTLAVVGALRNILFFTMLAHNIVRLFRTTRTSILALAYITFIGSMFIANDMALLTFLPLGYFVLSSTHNEKHLAFTFVIQNIAANLGGMLTPFGNPQNLYLFAKFEIPAGEFLRVMSIPFLGAAALIAVFCLLVPPLPISLHTESEYRPGRLRVALYLALFALAILLVFRVIPWPVGVIVIAAALYFTCRRALAAVDWGLLLTFFFFFIFAGNASRIPAVSELISGLLSKNCLLVSLLSCQVISNVPSAILLSRFTGDWQALLYGVNIGGTGTLVASLASLITFRTYLRYNPGRAKLYLGYFTGMNLVFLVLLGALCFLILAS